MNCPMWSTRKNEADENVLCRVRPMSTDEEGEEDGRMRSDSEDSDTTSRGATPHSKVAAGRTSSHAAAMDTPDLTLPDFTVPNYDWLTRHHFDNS